MCKQRDLNLVVDSLETLVAGLVLAVNRKMLQDDPHDHVVHFMHAFGNVNWAVLLIILGVVGIVISLGHIHRWYLDAILLSIYGGLWLTYFVAFFIQDMHFGPGLRIGTVLSCFVFIRILLQALDFPGHGRRSE